MKPTKTQDLFFNLPDDCTLGLLRAPRGTGKTAALVYLPIAKGWHEIKDFTGVLFAHSYLILKKIIMRECLKHYAEVGAKYNHLGSKFVFPSGAQIFLLPLDTQKHQYWARFNFLGFDDIDRFDPILLNFLCVNCCRKDKEHLPAVVRATSSEYFTWKYSNFNTKHWKSGEVLMMPDESEHLERRTLYAVD